MVSLSLLADFCTVVNNCIFILGSEHERCRGCMIKYQSGVLHYLSLLLVFVIIALLYCDKTFLVYHMFIILSNFSFNFHPSVLFLCCHCKLVALLFSNSLGAGAQSPWSLHGPLKRERMKVNYVRVSFLPCPSFLRLPPFLLIPSRHVELTPLLSSQLCLFPCKQRTCSSYREHDGKHLFNISAEWKTQIKNTFSLHFYGLVECFSLHGIQINKWIFT